MRWKYTHIKQAKKKVFTIKIPHNGSRCLSLSNWNEWMKWKRKAERRRRWRKARQIQDLFIHARTAILIQLKKQAREREWNVAVTAIFSSPARVNKSGTESEEKIQFVKMGKAWGVCVCMCDEWREKFFIVFHLDYFARCPFLPLHVPRLSAIANLFFSPFSSMRINQC